MSHSLNRFLSALIFFGLSGPAHGQPAAKLSNRTSHEVVQDCLRQIWGQPVFWDERAVAAIDTSVCQAKPEDLSQALSAQHFVAFRLPNAVLLAAENSFGKNNGPFSYQWKTPLVEIRVTPRVTPGSRQPTEAESRDIADTILKSSHLVPLTCPFKPSEGQTARLALSIFVEIHKMHPGSSQESVIALVADSDPDHETVFGTGRFVYGNLEDGHFQFQWETPLLETSMFESGFVDLLRNGNLQIILTANFGMGNHTAFYAFDLDGQEISRQPSTCEAFSDLAKHAAVACPISTETGVHIEDTASGPKTLVATSETGKKVRYLFHDGRYEASAPNAVRAASDPHATALNADGMKFMRQGDYETAIAKFQQAAQLDPTDPQFANNAGFAYYKLGRNDDSLYWFDKAIEIDPKRAVAYLNLGDAYVKLNRNAEARRAYVKYLELAPDSRSAPEVKGRLDALPLP
jgi:TolA-binding protein